MANRRRRRDTRQQGAAPAVRVGLPWFATLDGTRLLPVLIVAAALWAYHNSFAGAFLLDDEEAIVNNEAIRRPWPFATPWDALHPGSLLTLSLAANYALGELRPWGYHLVNLAVHVLAALTLYGLVRRTLLLGPRRARYEGSAAWLALAAALLWLVHPLQTESVTYVVQRSESMMGLFYLLTLYGVLRGAEAAAGAWRWYAAAVACCALGMLTKEVMVTAPLAALLYDRVFLAPRWRDALRRRWGLYAGLAATWALLTARVVALFTQSPVAATVGFRVPGITPLEYAASQSGVIVHYLRLTLWPAGQCLDYGWPPARTAWEVLPPALVLAALLAATLWALWRRPGLGWCGALFFLVLAPTSSIVPLKDLAFEHRMYLPLAAVVVVAVLAGEALAVAAGRVIRTERGRRLAAVGLVAGPVIVLGALTMWRNEDYRDPAILWADVVAKRPANPRGYNNLGNTLLTRGRSAEAAGFLREAVRLDPSFALAHYNLGNALTDLGQPAEAINHYREALRLIPAFPQAQYNLANALARQGHGAEAIDHYCEALRLDPRFVLAHYNLANALVHEGRPEEAVPHYQEAVRLDPGCVPAHGNLGIVLLRQGRPAEAVVPLREACRLDPGKAPVQNELGSALLRLGEWGEAAACFGRAVALEPGAAAYHRNLAYALYQQGRVEEAREEYRAAGGLDPRWPRAALRQAWALATHPDSGHRDGNQALLTAEQVLQAEGDQDPEVLDTLAAARAERGQFAEAADAARRALARARAAGQQGLARDIEGRLALYRERQPFRTASPPQAN
jgi:tetratricopeptide (TPR) repeat protein